MKQGRPQRKPISKSLRFDIFTRDHYTCQYCGRRAPQVTLHIEHMVSVVDGGSNHPSNLVAACTDCNYGKGSRSLIAIVAPVAPSEQVESNFFLDFEPGPGIDIKGTPRPIAGPVVHDPNYEAWMLDAVERAQSTSEWRRFKRSSYRERVADLKIDKATEFYLLEDLRWVYA